MEREIASPGLSLAAMRDEPTSNGVDETGDGPTSDEMHEPTMLPIEQPTKTDDRLPVGQSATLACLLEVCAPKPGNVHRGADFEDMGLVDFAASAAVVGPVFERAADRTIGETVVDTLRATRQVTPANTNLGIVLLFAPLAAVPHGTAFSQGIASVLDKLTPADATQVFQAIRDVQPGGLDPLDQEQVVDDVRHDSQIGLMAAMQQAASWDLVARQYTNCFDDVLNRVLPWLVEHEHDQPLIDRIVATHVRLMATVPDSLIARKCGVAVAKEAAARAEHALHAGPIGSEDYQRALSDLDFWLRSTPRRNPGTSADVVAAAIFAGLRTGAIRPPFSA